MLDQNGPDHVADWRDLTEQEKWPLFRTKVQAMKTHLSLRTAQ